MTDKPFLDTNVLVYTLGQHDHRTAIADELLEAGGVVSVQVLNELASVARRTLHMSWEDITAALDAIRTFCPSPVPLTVATHDSAVRLASKLRCHIYDASIIASALESDCSILFSEDLQSGRKVEGRLAIRNPFVR